MDWNVICFAGDIYSNVVVCTKFGVLAVGSAPNSHENTFCIFIIAHVSRSQVHNLLTFIFNNVSLYFSMPLIWMLDIFIICLNISY